MPIEQYPIKDTVNTGITYNRHLETIRAAVWAGATLSELQRWVDGEYPANFMSLVVAAYRGDGMIRNHSEDAVIRASERRSKHRRNRQ